MITITLNQAHAILEKASAFIWNDDFRFVTYGSLSDLIVDDPDNEFFYLSGKNDNGECYDVRFNQGANELVQIDGPVMILNDDEGDPIRVTVLMNATPEDMISNVRTETFSVGDIVDVDAQAGGNSYEFTGRVVGFSDGLIQVRDQDDDVYECVPSGVKMVE